MFFVVALPHIEEALSAERPSNDTFRLLGLLIFCFLSKSIKYFFSYLPKLFVIYSMIYFMYLCLFF